MTSLEVQINNGPLQPVSAFIDSGGLSGTIPSALMPNVPVGGAVPAGTTITVYNSTGQELYSETVTATNAPHVVSSGNPLNTGNYPFLLEPIYVSNSPGGVGTTIFDV